MATADAVGLPLGVSVWLVPVIVTGPTVPKDVLLEPASVIDSDPPVQADGIEPRAIEVTTSSTTVHEIVMPLSEPQELTLALADTTFWDVVLTLPAMALLGTASTAAVTAARAGLMRMVYPVMATDTPVTADAAMLLELKSGDAAPVASNVPVISPRDALLAPVSVTL